MQLLHQFSPTQVQLKCIHRRCAISHPFQCWGGDGLFMGCCRCNPGMDPYCFCAIHVFITTALFHTMLTVFCATPILVLPYFTPSQIIWSVCMCRYVLSYAFLCWMDDGWPMGSWNDTVRKAAYSISCQTGSWPRISDVLLIVFLFHHLFICCLGDWLFGWLVFWFVTSQDYLDGELSIWLPWQAVFKSILNERKIQRKPDAW